MYNILGTIIKIIILLNFFNWIFFIAISLKLLKHLMQIIFLFL